MRFKTIQGILILGLMINIVYGSVFPFLFPTPDTIASLISANIAPFFSLEETELSLLSEQLSKYFELPSHKELTQTNLRSALTRITNATTNVILSPTPPSVSDISIFFNSVQTALQNVGICAICQLVIALIKLDYKLLVTVLEVVCDIYILLANQNINNFCSGIINLNLPSLAYVRENSTIFDPQLACTILLQTKECRFNKPALSWESHVSTSPKIIPNIVRDTSLPPMKFLHITDFHVELFYKVGAVSNCGYPVCCLEGIGSPSKTEKCGAWGDYYGDMAPNLFRKSIEQISIEHKDVDVIFITGDMVDHTIWNTTYETNTEVIKLCFETILEFFPNVPVFPVIGNHESQPLNLFPPRDDGIEAAGMSQQWLYSLVAKLWTPWLSPEAIKSVDNHGYYAHNYSSTVKILGINSNLCYCYNWWLLYNTTFLQDHLNWINDQLEESENNGQFVIIVGHNSMGNGECIEPWENSYAKIIQRFSHIIKLQLIGHTHTDEMKIFYDEDNVTPINVAYNGASLTTFQFFNPNYKVMYVTPDTLEVEDVDTYIFNMTLANLTPNQDPVWYKLYSMKSQYGLPDLSPKSYDAWCDKMATDFDLRNQYWLNYVRYGDPSIQTGCDDKCQHLVHCKIPRTQTYKDIKPYCK